VRGGGVQAQMRAADDAQAAQRAQLDALRRSLADERERAAQGDARAAASAAEGAVRHITIVRVRICATAKRAMTIL
jgi:hypothetical protein